jgi:hypothetical protein
MTVRHCAAVACVTAATAGALTLAHARAGTTAAPSGAVESCATQSGADFPGAFRSPRNLVIGPLAFVGAGGSPSFVWNSARTEGFQKFPLLVRAGHRVTVELPRAARRGAGLGYGPLPQGETRLRDTHRVVAFVACRREEHPWSSSDGRPVTFWSGGVLARSPRCVPLLVWVDRERSPRRAVIRLGVRDCR